MEEKPKDQQNEDHVDVRDHLIPAVADRKETVQWKEDTYGNDAAGELQPVEHIQGSEYRGNDRRSSTDPKRHAIRPS